MMMIMMVNFEDNNKDVEEITSIVTNNKDKKAINYDGNNMKSNKSDSKNALESLFVLMKFSAEFLQFIFC